MEQEIERKVMSISRRFKKTMIEETGIKSSLNDEGIREYLEEVMKEIGPQNNGR